jgi:multiple sugar transport system substrate-binding protein
MSAPVTLRGITWNHSRGFVPKVATGQRFEELNPGVEIHWEKRSLQAFADQSIADLAENFDLLIIDHPSIGEAAAHGLFQPLDGLLPDDFLAGQAADSVGQSHASYNYGGHQWALAVDAATPVASWRQDLLDARGLSVPATWEEVLDLADRGMVAAAAVPIDSLMMFYMLCLDEGTVPGAAPSGFVADAAAGAAALMAMRELIARCDPDTPRRNPIQTYEAMTQGDTIAYCPFAYGYSNYARPGFARNRLNFGGLVARKRGRLRSTLGGAGLAISAHCKHPELAARYAQMMASPDCQRGLFMASGGQPGHRAAWRDAEANRVTGGFFRDTLSTLDEAWVRPRHDGYIAFQDGASAIVHACMLGAKPISATLLELDELHRQASIRLPD